MSKAHTKEHERGNAIREGGTKACSEKEEIEARGTEEQQQREKLMNFKMSCKTLMETTGDRKMSEEKWAESRERLGKFQNSVRISGAFEE